MNKGALRPLAGLGLVVVLVAVFVMAVGFFRGSFTETVPVTVISQRAGLVMNPDAKVKMRGVQVGTVESIDYQPDGTASIRLAMSEGELENIPDNVEVDITSSTVFGAKFIQFVMPADPSSQTLRPGQQLVGERVTVETNTVFEQLTRILDTLEPAKVNAVLAALSRAFSGRGEKIGQTLSDLNAFLAEVETGLPNLGRDLEMLPAVLEGYADAAPDLVAIADNATRLGETVVDEQQNLDALLIGLTGLANTGNDVVAVNGQPLANLIHLIVPTTDMLNRNHEIIGCTLQGLVPLTQNPPLPVPGVYTIAGLMPGRERYRYPGHLPTVNATAGPELCQILGLPVLQPGEVPPFVVTDVGANPWEYNQRGIILNSDGLKQILFGPIDGPPRNSSQVGMPG